MTYTTNIKSLGPPPTDAHWSYGPWYMQRISRQDANKLVKPPEMGYYTIAKRKEEMHLEVQNVSGDFYLASPHVPTAKWKDTFGVNIT